MLNELYHLSASIHDAGFSPPSWHKDFGLCPRRETFALSLDSKGQPGNLRSIPKDEIGSVRKYETENGVSFPSFNVPPLLRASEEAESEIKELQSQLRKNTLSLADLPARIEKIRELCTPLWVNDAGRLTKCLGLAAKMEEFLGDMPEDYAALHELITRAKRCSVPIIREQLYPLAMRLLLSSATLKEAMQLLRGLLIASADSRDKNVPKVSVLLELDDWTAFAYPPNHARVQEWLNQRLLDHNGAGCNGSSMQGSDAFGRALTGTDGKFPDSTLPVLGNVKLRAMSGESPCQTRYGRVDEKSFPTGTEARQSMKNALEWLANKERKGRTWGDISGACGHTRGDGKRRPIPGILLAYPSTLPPDPPELAALFGGNRDASQISAKFEAFAGRVTPALRGIVSEHPDADIRVFVLVKADKARTKVLVSRVYEAKRMIAAAESWQEGCNNVPTIRLNLGTEPKPVWVGSSTPFPAEAVQCINLVWLQSAARADPTHAIAIGEGISLLLEEGSQAERAARRALAFAVANGSQLLLAVGHADHRRDGSLKMHIDLTKHTQILPSLLGLLLHKLGREREEYMHTPPFLVGRMLAMADTLHKEYCTHVRKKDVPPQLIGNALMPAALDSPSEGLARLSQRLLVYQAWGNTTTDEGTGLAKWALQQLGKAAHEIGPQAIPERCDDTAKAEMLLGYLARTESKVDGQLEQDRISGEEGETDNA